MQKLPASAFINRDLSWLEFNRRVLAQARDPRTPLLERAKFIAIFSSNLDEFVMKRIGLLKRQIDANIEQRSPDGRTPREQLDACRTLMIELIRDLCDTYDEVRQALEDHGIEIRRYDELSEADRQTVGAWYRTNVFPVLTPLAVDPGHRFPFISNLSTSLGVMLSRPGHAERSFARVKIPTTLPALVALGESRFVSLVDVVAGNVESLFPGMEVEEILAFRVTRNAAIQQDDDEIDDLLEHVEAELRMRRFARPVRLEIKPHSAPGVLAFLLEELGLSTEDLYQRAGPLDFTSLFMLGDLDRPELKDRPFSPSPPPALADEDVDIFAVMRDHDILLHHPYESFHYSVERFIARAARDPDVLAIKQTLYRTSRDSPFVASLVRAAEEGKQVACLVELRARFDEHKNVRFARTLEKAGVHVAYGVLGLKTHCKCSLVVRREEQGLRCYAHVGTGNYHPDTAQLYTDLGLLTCDPAITSDMIHVFNALTGNSRQETYDTFLVAPFTMRTRIYEQIDREIANANAGRPARIIAKMNSMEDRRVAARLYDASRAGVQIVLIVRGFCCLRPGVEGFSENITVISIIGRYLEHSRVWHFASGEEDMALGDWFISSADWMYRNLNNRVEVASPVKDAHARRRLAHIFEVMLADRQDAWILHPDGSYTRREPDPDDAPDSIARQGTFESLMRSGG